MSQSSSKLGVVSSRYRPRRLRQRPQLRALMEETRLSVQDLIMPLFVHGARSRKREISSLPGQFQFSIEALVKECRELRDLGVLAVLLFGVPSTNKKDVYGRMAYASSGIVQQAIRALKKNVPGILVVTDVCLCSYTTHGHCGILRKRTQESVIDNDATLEILSKVAVSHAKAGADMVAPSDMMDRNVAVLREELDKTGFKDTAIMGYSAKFASAFYGPFREAAGSAPQFGDRKSYQLSPANAQEALREAFLDLEQGADVVMVKPALAYLDVIQLIKQRVQFPLAAYNVSGEYAMIKAAAANGWLCEEAAWQEMLLSIKRSGADMIITYWAKEAARRMGS